MLPGGPFKAAATPVKNSDSAAKSPCHSLSPHRPPLRLGTKSGRGEAFLLTVGAFLITVELLCLQSVEVLLRHTFTLQAKKLQL